MSSRRLAREYALQTLYYSEAGKLTQNDAVMFVNSFFENLDEQHFAFCKDIVQGVNKNKKEIDGIISSFSKNWSLERMSSVDRAILRMATYELVFSPDKTPIAAIIDESVELAKKYSTENSGKFLNGILDKIKTKRNG
ncbi:MAG: transcription antitermination factor NusB [Elusimicrobiaceae bacterium]|nr:transcription antitermination factor NusB [Elusimicrobiaceae bacterium]